MREPFDVNTALVFLAALAIFAAVLIYFGASSSDKRKRAEDRASTTKLLRSELQNNKSLIEERLALLREKPNNRATFIWTTSDRPMVEGWESVHGTNNLSGAELMRDIVSAYDKVKAVIVLERDYHDHPPVGEQVLAPNNRLGQAYDAAIKAIDAALRQLP